MLQQLNVKIYETYKKAITYLVFDWVLLGYKLQSCKGVMDSFLVFAYVVLLKVNIAAIFWCIWGELLIFQ